MQQEENSNRLYFFRCAISISSQVEWDLLSFLNISFTSILPNVVSSRPQCACYHLFIVYIAVWRLSLAPVDNIPFFRHAVVFSLVCSISCSSVRTTCTPWCRCWSEFTWDETRPCFLNLALCWASPLRRISSLSLRYKPTLLCKRVSQFSPDTHTVLQSLLWV